LFLSRRNTLYTDVMTKSTALSLLGAAAGLSMAAGLLWSQQAPAPPPARQPNVPFTAAEIEAIPLTPPRAGASVTKTLFDGKTLNGWDGSPQWWSVADGAIHGKSSGRTPTSFLYTKDNYTDFRLTLSSQMLESDNHAGVCFWGEVVVEGDNKWGTRGPLVIFPDPSMWDYILARGLRVYRTTTEKVTSQHEWVKVEILAQGNRVRTAMNGVQVMEWREPDANRIKAGPIGVQLHGFNGTQDVLYKDIVVETFPREDRLITLRK
jgi:hypothetical protein